MTQSVIILNHQQISHKIKRLAWQIYEDNMELETIYVAGIDNRGMFLAERIADELKAIGMKNIHLINIVIDRNNFEPQFFSDVDLSELKDQSLIIVDDVLNSGKTLISAFLPLLQRQVGKIRIAVLASRSYRLFPVNADFVGISMATTFQEHLLFDDSDINDLKLALN
jgi:pyrimidine operon attenuation protein / uracil phosphoribosyltransferase